MNLGISLSWDYLGGESKNVDGKILKKIFGKAVDSLKEFKEMGLSSVEARHFEHGISPDKMPVAVKSVVDAGLILTVHGEMKENNVGMDLFEIWPWLDSVMKYATYTSENPLIVPIHSFDGKTETKKYYEDKTVEVLSYILGEIEKHKLHIQIALEINQNREAKGVASPSYNFEDILNLFHRVNSKNLKFCFDFGHLYANVLKRTVLNEVPEEFAKNVIQTHIHDLGPRNKTHWPLEYNNVTHAKYISLLKDVSYDGPYNLELTFRRFYTDNPVETKQKIINSFDKIRKEVLSK